MRALLPQDDRPEDAQIGLTLAHIKKKVFFMKKWFLILILVLLLAALPLAVFAAGKTGDANGDGRVNAADAMLILRYAVRKVDASQLDVSVIDVTGDGKINTTDAMTVLRYAVRKISSFPVDEAAEPTLPPHTHSYTAVVTPPTCGEEGYTTYTCTCGHSYTGNPVPAGGHAYTVTEDTATCTETGTRTEICQACGDTRQTESPAKGHGDIRTETTDYACSQEVKKICGLCEALLSFTTVDTAAHVWQYQPLTVVIHDEIDRGLMSQPQYLKMKDHSVAVCTVCKTSNFEDIVQTYSDYEMAEIMLGYVNALREEVHGTDEYNLVLDERLIASAKAAAKEISTNGFVHTRSNENIAKGHVTMLQQFNAWKNSPAHYENMINADENSVGYCGYTRFGYGIYWEGTYVYAVQHFGY